MVRKAQSVCRQINQITKEDMERKATTIMGLILSIFGYLFIQTIQNLPALSTRLSEQSLTFLGLILIWILVASLLVIIKWGEKRPLSSIGYKSISLKEIIIAIVIGVVLSLTVPLLTILTSQIIPSTPGGIDDITSTTSWWLILISIITAGIAEEIVFRGYIIERISKITMKNWIGVVISVVAFILPHTISWNLTHVIGVVLPLGIILSGLYLWKRNLFFNMIVHIVIDLPLVVIALMTA